MEEQQRGSDEAENALAAISGEMVRLYKEQFGRGPTRARTYWASPDIVVCVLEDTLTPVERNLLRLGQHERLRDTRVFFQYASTEAFCEPIERITGRTVRAFHSSIDTMADGMALEAFVLYPAGTSHPSRALLSE